MNSTETNPSKAPNPYLAIGVYTFLVVFGLLALRHAGLLFVPLFVGFVFAFLLTPLQRYLLKWTGYRRSVCAAVIVMTLFLALMAVLIPLIPYLLTKITAAAEKLPETLAQFSSKVEIFNQYLNRNYPDFVGKIDLMSQIEQVIHTSLGKVSENFFNLFSNLYGVVLMAAYIVLVPLFTFFLLRDYQNIKSFIMTLVPQRLERYFREKLHGFNCILAAYIRGQSIVVIVLCILYSIGLSLIGLPFPVVIGVFSGLGDIIPYFGTIVGLTFSLIIGMVHFYTIKQTLLILVVFGVIKGAENWFIYPKIVGFRVGLPFAWALLSFIAFGKLFGFWGLLVAIPCSAGFKLFLQDVYSHYRKSKYFRRD